VLGDLPRFAVKIVGLVALSGRFPRCVLNVILMQDFFDPPPLLTGNKPFLRVPHYLWGILGWSVNDGIFSKLSKALWKSIVLPDGAYVLHDEICIYAMYGVAAENWLA